VPFDTVAGEAAGVDGLVLACETNPQRAELSADLLAVVRGRTGPSRPKIVGSLDEQQRTVLRIRPEKVVMHD
jgi:hypothetical protein